MKKNFLTLLLAAFTFFTISAHAAPLSRAEVESIVDQYIQNNGDKIMASVAAYQQRQQAAKVTGAIKYYNPSQGPAKAPVTIIEFIDYECPFCSRVQPTLKQLRAQYGQRIRWVAKYLPLDFHAKARPAAYAAQAAHIQGKFWAFNDKLWERQDYLSDQTYQDIAKELGLNMSKFNTDRASAAVKAAIDSDLKDAEMVGARGTPHFLINGASLSGAQPIEAFTQVIEAALNPGKR